MSLYTKYLYAVYIDEPILLIDRTSAGTQPAGTDELFYYHRNSLYSIAALTNQAGSVVERYTYTAYGHITFHDASGNPSNPQQSTVSNPYTYTGRRLDEETGLYYYRARYYDTDLGRFIGRDPIGLEAGDLSLYGYVGSSPLLYIDPNGEEKKPKLCTRTKTVTTIKHVISAKAEAVDKDDHITKDEQKAIAVWALKYFKGQSRITKTDTCGKCTDLRLLYEFKYSYDWYEESSRGIWIFHGPKAILIHFDKQGWLGEKGPLKLRLRTIVKDKVHVKVLTGCCEEEEPGKKGGHKSSKE